MRDPIDRAISQFTFEIQTADGPTSRAMSTKPSGKDLKCKANSLNRRIHTVLGGAAKDIQRVEKEFPLVTSLKKTISCKECATVGDCHWLPQWLYVEGTCDHVLRFERLSQDFSLLMKRFEGTTRGTNTLADAVQNANASLASECTTLSRHDLDEESRALLSSVYEYDFEMFGYPTEFGALKHEGVKADNKLPPDNRELDSASSGNNATTRTQKQLAEISAQSTQLSPDGVSKILDDIRDELRRESGLVVERTSATTDTAAVVDTGKHEKGPAHHGTVDDQQGSIATDSAAVVDTGKHKKGPEKGQFRHGTGTLDDRQDNMTVALCSLMTLRMEAPHLLPWVAYHLLIGVDHIHLYHDDRSGMWNDKLIQLHRPLMNYLHAHKQVTLHSMTEQNLESQQDQIDHCTALLSNHLVGGLPPATWVGNFDIDEMVVGGRPHDSARGVFDLKRVLRSLGARPQTVGVLVPRFTMGGQVPPRASPPSPTHPTTIARCVPRPDMSLGIGAA